MELRVVFQRVASPWDRAGLHQIYGIGGVLVGDADADPEAAVRVESLRIRRRLRELRLQHMQFADQLAKSRLGGAGLDLGIELVESLLAPGMFSLGREECWAASGLRPGFRVVALKATNVPIHGKDTTQSMAFITQAGPLPALLENASDEQRIRATEAVRNASPQILEQTGAACMWGCGLYRR